jgi:hypothetical protein
MPIGPPVPNKQWAIRCPLTDDIFRPGSDSGRSVSRLNYFLLLFPPDQMVAMIELTNEKLVAKGAKALTKGEMLKFIAIVMLCTRFEFRERASLDRKPEVGCEIQNTACGRSGIMLRLKLVETAESERAHAEVDADTGLLHGTKVLKFLVMPWVRTGRIVCADSYFASIPVAAELRRLGLHFIGVVKTASRMFPKITSKA